jgi:CRISPR-associated endonuclease/helicase Cas3
MDEVRAFFKRLVGNKAFGEYQLAPANSLQDGKSIVMRAPTGSGKSEAILCGYLWALLQSEAFPQQTVYALPMRCLVDSLAKRFADYLGKFNLSVAGHHGGHPATPLFYADVVVATIDQIVGAYACTPLSLPVRHGNIPAGAVASAFLAFDEVHTFDPERALQSALVLAEHSRKLNIPFAFLSATLPDSFVEALQECFDAELIDVREEEVPVRKKRRVILSPHLDNMLTPQEVQRAWEEGKGSLLAVCNTVDRAQALWEEVRNLLPGIEVTLLHSRFWEEDRAEKERKLKEMLGKKPKRCGILIATQVVEVGLDISASVLLTEVAPADALIQRAGRVARWGGEGEVRVFDVEKAAPYDEELVKDTKRCICSGVLSWGMEKALVNKVLGPRLACHLTARNRGKVLYWLAEGAFKGSRRQVEEAVRENLACEVSIHDRPVDLGREVMRLPRIRMPIGILRRFAKERGSEGIWRVIVDEQETIAIDQRPMVQCVSVRGERGIAPHGFYVLSPAIAAYEPDGRGLMLGEPGRAMQPVISKKKRRGLWEVSERESWVVHSCNVLDAFFELYEPRYRAMFQRLANLWRISYEKFLNKVTLTIAFHDLGKLNQKWQYEIGRRSGEEPFGHSGDYAARGRLPPHATVSAYLLYGLFRGWGRLGDAMAYAVAHHHSVRATIVPKYALIPEWEEQVEGLLRNYPRIQRLWQAEPVRELAEFRTLTTLPSRLPPITDARTWRTYVILARALRLSDWVATGGSEDVILRYEDWFADV